LRGMLLVLVILGFSSSARDRADCGVTIPFALLFAFICLDWRHIPPTCFPSGPSISESSWTVPWSWWRTSSARSPRGRGNSSFSRSDSRAAHDVERLFFNAIAVIIAGYLPIYVLTALPETLPADADTMSFALLGALLCALTVLPVLCAIPARPHQGTDAKVYEWVRRSIGGRSDGACATVWSRSAWCWRYYRSSLLLIPGIGASSCRTWMKAALGARHTLYHFFRGSFRPFSADPQHLMSFPQVTTVAPTNWAAG